MADSAISNFSSAAPLEDSDITVISKENDLVQYNAKMSDIKIYIQESFVVSDQQFSDGISTSYSTNVTGNEVAGSSTLVDGTVTIYTTSCKSTSHPVITMLSTGTLTGTPRVTVNEGNFIVSTGETEDTSDFLWHLVSTFNEE